MTREKTKLVCSVIKCPRTKMVDRTDLDHPKAERMEIICPWHDDGDFHEPTYYDKNDEPLLDDFLNPNPND